MIVKRRLEEGFEKIRTSMPALLTVIGEMNTPRYPVVSNLLDACREKAPIKVWNAADIGVTTSEVGLEGSFTNVIKTFAPKSGRAGEVLEGDTKTQVKTLIGKLKENLLV
jgi:electron transfer flavoprotein beta subunit